MPGLKRLTKTISSQQGLFRCVFVESQRFAKGETYEAKRTRRNVRDEMSEAKRMRRNERG